MRRWEKRELRAWRRRFDAEAPRSQLEVTPAEPRPATEPAPALSQREHLQGLWIALSLADEANGERESEFVTTA